MVARAPCESTPTREARPNPLRNIYLSTKIQIQILLFTKNFTKDINIHIITSGALGQACIAGSGIQKKRLQINCETETEHSDRAKAKVKIK